MSALRERSNVGSHGTITNSDHGRKTCVKSFPGSGQTTECVVKDLLRRCARNRRSDISEPSMRTKRSAWWKVKALGRLQYLFGVQKGIVVRDSGEGRTITHCPQQILTNEISSMNTAPNGLFVLYLLLYTVVPCLYLAIPTFP